MRVNMKYVLVQLLVLPLVYSNIPKLWITVYSSIGIKVCVLNKDIREIKKIEFHANVNDKISIGEIGQISGFLENSISGWCLIDRNKKISEKNKINYWVETIENNGFSDKSEFSKIIRKKDIFDDKNSEIHLVKETTTIKTTPAPTVHETTTLNVPFQETHDINNENEELCCNSTDYFNTVNEYLEFIEKSMSEIDSQPDSLKIYKTLLETSVANLKSISTNTNNLIVLRGSNLKEPSDITKEIQIFPEQYKIVDNATIVFTIKVKTYVQKLKILTKAAMENKGKRITGCMLALGDDYCLDE